MNRFLHLSALSCFLLALSFWAQPGKSWAQPVTCSASGLVLDEAGEPIQGATVSFTPHGNPTFVYERETNKRGRYEILLLWTPAERNRWNVKLVAEGYLPVKVRIETRTVHEVLISEMRTIPLGLRSRVPPLQITPLGSIEVDFTVAPEGVVRRRAYEEPPSVAQEQEEEEVKSPVEVGAGPWAMALTKANQGQLEESLEDLAKAIEQKPEDIERQAVLAYVLYRLKRYDEAEEVALKAAAAEPENLQLQLSLYSIYQAKGDLDAARARLTSARELDPKDLEVLTNVGYLAEEIGDLDAAVEAFETVIELDPENAAAWGVLGSLYADLGQSEKSEAAYQQVIELDPESAPLVYYNQGALTVSKKDLSEKDRKQAVSLFKKAIDLDPNHALAYKEMGLALLGLADKEGAKKALQKYFELAGDSPNVDRLKAIFNDIPG